jgi:hypothetical protein
MLIFDSGGGRFKPAATRINSNSRRVAQNPENNLPYE